MEVGQSIALETSAAKKLIANAQNWGKACKPEARKFVMRQVDAEQSRIWRMK